LYNIFGKKRRKGVNLTKKGVNLKFSYKYNLKKNRNKKIEIKIYNRQKKRKERLVQLFES